jgi:hypothetical protein
MKISSSALPSSPGSEYSSELPMLRGVLGAGVDLLEGGAPPGAILEHRDQSRKRTVNFNITYSLSACAWEACWLCCFEKIVLGDATEVTRLTTVGNHQVKPLSSRRCLPLRTWNYAQGMMVPEVTQTPMAHVRLTVDKSSGPSQPQLGYIQYSHGSHYCGRCTKVIILCWMSLAI